MVCKSVKNMKRLCACLLNVSEARRRPIVEKIANAALRVNGNDGGNHFGTSHHSQMHISDSNPKLNCISLAFTAVHDVSLQLDNTLPTKPGQLPLLGYTSRKGGGV